MYYLLFLWYTDPSYATHEFFFDQLSEMDEYEWEHDSLHLF